MGLSEGRSQTWKVERIKIELVVHSIELHLETLGRGPPTSYLERMKSKNSKDQTRVVKPRYDRWALLQVILNGGSRAHQIRIFIPYFRWVPKSNLWSQKHQPRVVTSRYARWASLCLEREEHRILHFPGRPIGSWKFERGASENVAPVTNHICLQGEERLHISGKAPFRKFSKQILMFL